jgi:hypothetical protein
MAEGISAIPARTHTSAPSSAVIRTIYHSATSAGSITASTAKISRAQGYLAPEPMRHLPYQDCGNCWQVVRGDMADLLGLAWQGRQILLFAARDLRVFALRITGFVGVRWIFGVPESVKSLVFVLVSRVGTKSWCRGKTCTSLRSWLNLM